MAYWLSTPVQLHSGRDFDCATYGGMTPEQCVEYERHWVYWFESDRVYALPTVAFFMCTIGVFIVGYLVSQSFGYSRRTRWRSMLAVVRYASYRGCYIRQFQWISPPVGILLLLAIGIVYFLCMTFLPRPYYWPDVSMDTSPPLGTRSGFLAVACMPFIFATSSKANWITLVTGISHEKLSIFHRWISFAFFFLALVHALAFVVYHIHFHDMVDQVTQVEPEEYWTGIVALVFQAWLTFASLTPIRKLGYEFFKFSHYFSAIVFMLMFFWHCDGSLTSWDYFIATAAVYVPSLVYPWLRTCFEYGNHQKAEICVEEHGVVSISIPVGFNWVPGQHCFLRFTGFGMQALSSHPFSICTLPSETPDKSSSAVFYARKRGGLTARLYNFAKMQPKSTGVSVDGPYGGIDLRKFHANDHMLVIAGGSAAGWTLPFIAQFARLVARSTEDAQDRSMRVVLTTRDEKTRRWFMRAVGNVLSQDPKLIGLSLDLHIWVHFTGETGNSASSPDSLSITYGVPRVSLSSDERDIKSQEKTEELDSLHSRFESQQHRGRPNLQAFIKRETVKAANAGQAVGIFVCGPPSMQNDVRNAAALENSQIMRGSNLRGGYLYCEHFSWA